MSFLFVWQTLVQRRFPWLGLDRFRKICGIFAPLPTLQTKAISGGLVIFIVILLYRRITTIGKISVLPVDRPRGNDAMADLGRGHAFQRQDRV